MKNFLFNGLLLAFALVSAGFGTQVQAQNPRLDPAFQPTELYRPGVVRQVAVQPDGKTLFIGEITRINGVGVPVLARLLPGSGQLDAAFQANVAGLQGFPFQLALVPNGKILLFSGSQTIALGTVSRTGFLLLNADGTPDASFDAGTGIQSFNELQMLGQPDGKIVIAGNFTTFNNQAVRNLVRLNTNGSLDAGFQGAGPGLSAQATALALQADGKVLVGGDFTTVQGISRPRLARLLPTGALDATFSTPGGVSQVFGLGVLANGNIMLLGGVVGQSPLVRLLPSGAVDATFQPGTNLVTARRNFFDSRLLVLANGNVLVSGPPAARYNGSPVGRLFQVLPSGALDPGFANTTALISTSTFAFYRPVLAELPNGQILVGGDKLVPAAGPTTGLVRLNANGTRDAAFTANVQQPGYLNDLVLQPNGQVVVGGDFTELNGSPVSHLARLSATGVVETAFTAAAAPDRPVTALLLQPDGNLLVGGEFGRIGGSPQAGLARLLPAGTRDATFAPPFVGQNALTQVAVQPGGQVLALGSFRLNGSGAGGLQQFVQLNGTTGAYDASFQPADSVQINQLLVQPSGKILVAGIRLLSGQSQAVWQLLPSGANDLTFNSDLIPVTITAAQGLALGRSATGQAYLARITPRGATGSQTDVLRLLPTGAADPVFQYNAPYYQEIRSIAVQPNGRILLGGFVSPSRQSNYRGSLRLLANGALDGSYNYSLGPDGGVARVVVQPDGALLMAGDFAEVSGLPVLGLTRLLDPNVLGLRPGERPLSLAAWPVPAHDALNVQLSGRSSAYTLELLDVMGRAVLRRTVGATATVPLAGVAPGVYLLRYSAPGEAGGSRRIVVE